MCLFSRTHAWVSRVASHATAFNIGIIIVWLFTVFIEMQQYKGPGNKKFCTIHSRSSLDLVEWAAFRTIDSVRISAYQASSPSTSTSILIEESMYF